MTDRPKAYSYVRFSTPEQALGDSKRRQVEKAEQYALAHSLELVDEHYMDLGVSAYRGRNKDEGALADFLQAVKDGVVAKGSYLLVESMDRISREKPRKAVRLLEDICDSGIVLVTVGDGKVYDTATLDADPMAFMWAFMVAIRANEESEVKAKRVREAWGRKKVAAASDGKPMTERLPAWLSMNPDRSGFSVIEDRATVVRRMFKDADKGIGQHTIAHRLNAEGVGTFGDGGRKAAFWHRSYIAKILKNPAVIGTMTPHETRIVEGKKRRDPLAPIPSYYPAIVPVALFNRVNTRMGKAPRMRATKGEVSNVLASLAACPSCGSTMTRVNKGRKGGTPYLVCTRAKVGAGCEYRQVNLEAVTAAIRHAGPRQLTHGVPTGDIALDGERENLQRATDGLSYLIGNIVEEIESGNTSPALRRRLSELEAELADAEHQLEAVHVRLKQSGGRAVAKIVDKLEHVLADKSASLTAMNLALRDAFTRCVVDFRSGDLRFYWRQGGDPTLVPYSIAD